MNEVNDPGAAAQGADELHSLSFDARLESMKREIDALQINLLATKHPWYRNVSTLLSFLALCFSFGTTFVSYHRTKQLDIEAARTELRGFIQRLGSLPKENLQLSKTYNDDQLALGSLKSFITQENTLVAKQAAEVIRRIPEQVSATEYSAVAYALWSIASNATAIEFVKQAIMKASDVNDEAATLRQYGGYLMASGNVNGARVEYQKALAVFSKYPGYGDYYQNSSHAFTELHWAQSEGSVGNFPEMKLHLDAAEALAGRLSSGPEGTSYKQQIGQLRNTCPGQWFRRMLRH